MQLLINIDEKDKQKIDRLLKGRGMKVKPIIEADRSEK